MAVLQIKLKWMKMMQRCKKCGGCATSQVEVYKNEVEVQKYIRKMTRKCRKCHGCAKNQVEVYKPFVTKVTKVTNSLDWISAGSPEKKHYVG